MERYFSVIIPLYNKRKYIQRAIDSVLSQTYKNFEIIVVNDGSEDGSELIVENYDNKNIKLINQENSGVAIARNVGVFSAQYDFVCLLDADDEWKPNFLEEISALITTFPKHHIYSTRHEIIGDEGELLYPKNYFQENYRGVIKNFISCYKKTDGLINASSVCLRKSFFHKLGGFPASQTQGEDVYLWLLYSLHTDIVFSNTICTRYYRNTENRSVDSITKTSLPFQFLGFRSLINDFDSSKLKANSNKELVRYLRKNALLHVADLKSRNRNEVAISHTSQLFKLNKTTGLLCYLIVLMPCRLLRYSKRIRNHGRKSA